jgi:hypothetical protein
VIQMNTTENFDSVATGMDMSIPLTISPWKSGNNNWSKHVENKKLEMASALKH